MLQSVETPGCACATGGFYRLQWVPSAADGTYFPRLSKLQKKKLLFNVTFEDFEREHLRFSTE